MFSYFSQHDFQKQDKPPYNQPKFTVIKTWSQFPLLVQGLFTMTDYWVKWTFVPYLWLASVREISCRKFYLIITDFAVKLSQGTLPLKCCRFLTLQQNDAIQRYRCCRWTAITNSQSRADRLLPKGCTAKSSSPTPKGSASFSVAKHFFSQLHSLRPHRIPVPILAHNGSQ